MDLLSISFFSLIKKRGEMQHPDRGEDDSGIGVGQARGHSLCNGLRFTGIARGVLGQRVQNENLAPPATK